MKKIYYRVETQIDCAGVVHLPCGTVTLLIEVGGDMSPNSADENDPRLDEMSVAIKTAEDIIKVKYPVENASYCMKKPILENNPSSTIEHGELITTADGSKGWLLTSEMSGSKA